MLGICHAGTAPVNHSLLPAVNPSSMKSHFECRKCGKSLSDDLEPVSRNFEPFWPDRANMIPRGRYWLARDITPNHLNGHYLIHPDDRRGLFYHPDSRRHNGCCGRDGCDGPNQICGCGVEAATEVSDCWTSWFVHFEPAAVTLFPPPAPGRFRAHSSPL